MFLAAGRHAGRGGLPHKINLRRGQAAQAAEALTPHSALRIREIIPRSALHIPHSTGGAGGRDGGGAFVLQRMQAGGGLVSIVRTAREGDKPWRRSSSSTGRIYGLTHSPTT
jgi:hypothetical protein